jgi:hypothetical protein
MAGIPSADFETTGLGACTAGRFVTQGEDEGGRVFYENHLLTPFIEYGDLSIWPASVTFTGSGAVAPMTGGQAGYLSTIDVHRSG